MKTFIIAIFLLTLSVNCFSQEIKYNTDGSVDLHFKNPGEWGKYKKKNIYMSYDMRECDSILNTVMRPAIAKAQDVIKTQDSLVKKYDLQIENKVEQITMLQAELIDVQTKREPIFRFDGFYCGVKTGYMFTDTVFSKTSFTSALMDNISVLCKAVIKIKEFEITPMLEIPFNRRSTGVFVELGWKPF